MAYDGSIVEGALTKSYIDLVIFSVLLSIIIRLYFNYPVQTQK
jgi:hypothetical protein